MRTGVKGPGDCPLLEGESATRMACKRSRVLNYHGSELAALWRKVSHVFFISVGQVASLHFVATLVLDRLTKKFI